MLKFVVLAAVIATANAGGLVAAPAVASVATSYAAGPALGAPLLGKVTYNAPETTIVKQPVVVDQPEIRYRAIPTVVQTAPIVKTVTPVVHQHLTYAAPAVKTIAAPAYAYAAAPAFNYAAAPALTYAAAPAAFPAFAQW